MFLETMKHLLKWKEKSLTKFGMLDIEHDNILESNNGHYHIGVSKFYNQATVFNNNITVITNT